MTIHLYSFGYRHRESLDKIMAAHANVRVYDCRYLANPHNVLSLRNLTGQKAEVQDYVTADPKGLALLSLVVDHYQRGLICDGEAVAFGCYGGVHRSVALAELAAPRFREYGVQVEVTHLEL